MYADDHDGWLPYNYRRDPNADMCWLTVTLRDTLGVSYGGVQAVWDCPSIRVCP